VNSRQRWVLVLTSLASLMVALDGSAAAFGAGFGPAMAVAAAFSLTAAAVAAALPGRLGRVEASTIPAPAVVIVRNSDLDFS
jgi:hypothetical protein